MEEEDADIACIKESYLLGNKIGGISHSLTVPTTGERKKRAAIVIDNKNIDALMVNQLFLSQCVRPSVTHI
jgi:hypothetical protein